MSVLIALAFLLLINASSGKKKKKRICISDFCCSFDQIPRRVQTQQLGQALLIQAQ